MVKNDPLDDESLWPDNGYAVVEMDEYKHPSSEDFMIVLGQFDNSDDVTIPGEKEGYTYYIHGADKDSWSRGQWNNEMA